jgi:hypothetical protein
MWLPCYLAAPTATANPSAILGTARSPTTNRVHPQFHRRFQPRVDDTLAGNWYPTGPFELALVGKGKRWSMGQVIYQMAAI